MASEEMGSLKILKIYSTRSNIVTFLIDLDGVSIYERFNISIRYNYFSIVEQQMR